MLCAATFSKSYFKWRLHYVMLSFLAVPTALYSMLYRINLNFAYIPPSSLLLYTSCCILYTWIVPTSLHPVSCSIHPAVYYTPELCLHPSTQSAVVYSVLYIIHLNFCLHPSTQSAVVYNLLHIYTWTLPTSLHPVSWSIQPAAYINLNCSYIPPPSLL